MVRGAALRPLNLVVLVVGVGMFLPLLAANVAAWWLLPITLATYASLVFLAARDPIFQQKVLGETHAPHTPLTQVQGHDVSPERRARWLPRGETRQKVDHALDVYRKVVVAIENSDDVTRTVLEDTVPRLHAAADRLVDVAIAREKAAEAVLELSKDTGRSPGTARKENLRKIEERIALADTEISATSEELLDLRAKVVRISIDSANPNRTKDLNASLDVLNARLEALDETMEPQQEN